MVLRQIKFMVFFLLLQMPLLCCAQARNWEALYVFGDSYSDSGAGYLDGNGPTAVVYLAESLGIPFTHAGDPNALGKSLNFAVSGAQTGSGEGSPIKAKSTGAQFKDALLGRGMRNQVLDFTKRVNSGAIRFNPDETLFFLAGGLNDGELPTATTIVNLEDEIRQLYDAGGRYFLVAVLPTKIPAFSAVGIRLNPALKGIPEDLRSALPGAHIGISNWGKYFDQVIEEPTRYGITNATDRCAGREVFGEDATPCTSPGTYFYYHAGHPSTAVHRIVARKLETEVANAFPAKRSDSLEQAPASTQEKAAYLDGRPTANLRYEARDVGVVLPFGKCPQSCDTYGARDVWVFKHGQKYYMHYDAAGPMGWLTALATSRDLYHWTEHGTVLTLGVAGSEDAASASYGTTYFDGKTWHMFYLGTPHTSAPPDRVPEFPYLTMKATADSPQGPWRKQPEAVPFRPQPGTYYSSTASPGQIIRQGKEYLQFFSASDDKPIHRTLSIARTEDLNGSWIIDREPILPPSEQVENSSLYFEQANNTWFLFTNHVGISTEGEYTDAIWVYWSKDLNHWDTAKKAVVLDGRNCKWSRRSIGLPSVVRYGKRLAIFYDAAGGDSSSHMRRSIGLAWMNLPLKPPG
jgi:phospholipase/lecithinase/hemolysin/predicted GH43/DUF377 family glycosyl hydrolase